MSDTGERRPLSADPNELGFVPRPMVCWLSPRQLATTGLRVVLSALFGVYADKREIQAGLGQYEVVDRSGSPELWFDYISDLGDGFDPTYELALQLAAGKLTFEVDGSPVATPAGDLVIMGGDQVYPTSSRLAYEDRLVGPYQAALPWADDHRVIYAIPGNHDWYDGLSSFMRVFCQQDYVGGWKTEQSRSYFAIRLPHRWWLWGIDIQFDTYIDEPQRAYFDKVIGPQLQEGDSIILCSAKPNWVKVIRHPDAFANLDYFDRKVIRPRGAHVRLFLTGDSHHYARYAPEEGSVPQFITAGGRGAFLAATHHLPDRIELPPPTARDRRKTSPPKSFVLRTAYPDKTTSRRLRLGVLRLPFRNPGFWMLVSFVYALLGLIALESQRDLDGALVELVSRLPFGGIAREILRNGLGVVILVGLFLGMTAFTQEESPRKRWLIGGLHGLAQIVLALAFVRLAATLAGSLVGRPAQIAFFGVLLGVGGLMGAWLMGLYLLAADRFGTNTNELFASQRIEDYKCFLRLHIDEEGSLTVYPVAVDRVGHDWRFKPDGDVRSPWFEAERPGTAPRLIEPPIKLRS